MLGPEYWDAINSAVYFVCSGETAEEAFMALVHALGEGYWYQPTSDGTLYRLGSPEVIPTERTHLRGFVLIEDEPATIARRLREAADRDGERPCLRQWATAVEQEPENFDSEGGSMARTSRSGSPASAAAAVHARIAERRVIKSSLATRVVEREDPLRW